MTIVAMGDGARAWVDTWNKGTDESGFILGINNAHDIYGFKPDAIIAMDDLRRDRETHPAYVKSITTAGCPVWVCTAYPEYPSTKAYPLKDVIEWTNSGPRMASKVLNNTCCYALALAGLLGYDEIYLVGFQFVLPDDKEYVLKAHAEREPGEPDWFHYYIKKPLVRRPQEPGLEGCAYWVGVLTAMGRQVAIQDGTTFMDMDRPDFFYGYQEQPEL
jgi:hypothetical protein